MLLLRSHEEPTADQGQAESKPFNQSKNHSQISEVYGTKSKGRRIVEKQSKDQKPGIRCAKYKNRARQEL